LSWIGKHHKAIAPSYFLSQMAGARRKSLEAMMMDM